MYEVFPIVAGVVAALTVPRIASGTTRNAIYAVLAAVVAVLATVVAGEEWFFVFVDLAEVVLAIGVTIAVNDHLPSRGGVRQAVDVR